MTEGENIKEPISVQQEMQKLFADQREGEEIIYCFMEHWINVFTRALKFLILTSVFAGALFIIFYLYNDRVIDDEMTKWSLLSVFVVYLFLFHRATLNMFDLLMNIYIITNTRIIIVDKDLFFRDDKKIVDLRKIHDISSTKNGLFQNIFNYGNIEIVLASTNGVIEIKSIPRPSEIVEMIDRAKRASIENRGNDQDSSDTD